MFLSEPPKSRFTNKRSQVMANTVRLIQQEARFTNKKPGYGQVMARFTNKKPGTQDTTEHSHIDYYWFSAIIEYWPLIIDCYWLLIIENYWLLMIVYWLLSMGNWVLTIDY
jgi:hypothetical protein